MELRLEKLRDSLKEITNFKNFDRENPTVIRHKHPTLATYFTIVLSVKEPVNIQIPFNAIWIVINPSSKYFNQVLKLRDFEDPNTSTVAGAIKDEGLTATWISISRYDQVFNETQTPTTPTQGERGDQGFINRGNYVAGIYAFGDVVYSEGSSYVSNLANNSNPLTHPSWAKLCDAGVEPVVDYDYILQEIENALNP